MASAEVHQGLDWGWVWDDIAGRLVAVQYTSIFNTIASLVQFCHAVECYGVASTDVKAGPKVPNVALCKDMPHQL